MFGVGFFFGRIRISLIDGRRVLIPKVDMAGDKGSEGTNNDSCQLLPVAGTF